MKEEGKSVPRRGIDEFLDTYLTYALVVRATLDAVQKLKRAVSEMKGVKVVYQHLDTGKVKIVKEGNNS